MDKFTVQPTSSTSADVLDDIVLSQTKTTRRIFRAMIVRRPESLDCKIKGWLIHQRKGPKDEWEDVKDLDLTSLKAGEGIKLELDSEQTTRLMAGLENLAAIAQQRRIPFGRKSLVVAEAGSIIHEPDAKKREIIHQLIKNNFGDEIWKILLSTAPELAKRLSYSQVQLEREKSLKIFETHLASEDWDERLWEQFFFDNQWIFGYGLRYQFLGIQQRQANYGGSAFDRKGEQKGEFLTSTSGYQKFTVLVEIKRPDTELFDEAKGNYRSGVPTFSNEFVQAISQIQVNTRTWDKEGSERIRDREKLSAANVSTITPSSILIIGKTDELTSSFDKRNAFELFRRSLRNPDIITFDELFERARFIVSQSPIR